MEYIDAFERTVRRHGTDTAVVTDDGREFTYREFDGRITRLSNALADRIGDGRLAVLAANGPAAVEAMHAGHRRGAATVQLPFRGKAGELVAMAETADAAGLLFDDANAENALAMLERGDFETALHAGERDVDRTDVESYEAVLSGADEAPVERAGDECSVFYTSGTTSVPKAVLFDSEDMWLGAVQGVMEHGIDETDTALVTTPWYHMVTSDAWLYPHFVAGATAVLHGSFDPEEALDLVEAHGVTGLLAVPTQIDSLNDVQAASPRDVSTLEYIRTGGSVVTEELVERTHDLLSDQLYNTYGLTEGGPNLSFAHPSAQADHPGTIGKEAHTWELRVVEAAPLDEHPDPEATVAPGERGEVIGRSPGMSSDYIDNPEAAEKTYFDGWLRTRDVARIDEDGYLYITGRVDNMFVSGGENVYPAEVERTLESHDAVREAMVFGLDDDHWGKVVTAVVVTDGSVSEEDLDAYCKAHDSLANYKRPRRYAVTTDPLPRTDTGTVRREEVIAAHFG